MAGLKMEEIVKWWALNHRDHCSHVFGICLNNVLFYLPMYNPPTSPTGLPRQP